MSQVLLVAAVALTVGVIVFGVSVLATGDDRGLRPAEPDGRSRPLPADRPLAEPDLSGVRFDTVLRGYRMAQVDAALRRAAYDLGYKEELIKVLQAEVAALRAGRTADAEVLRRSREAAVAPVSPAPGDGESAPAPGDGQSAPEPGAPEPHHAEDTEPRDAEPRDAEPPDTEPRDAGEPEPAADRSGDR